jgi:hypothetical protein
LAGAGLPRQTPTFDAREGTGPSPTAEGASQRPVALPGTSGIGERWCARTTLPAVCAICGLQVRGCRRRRGCGSKPLQASSGVGGGAAARPNRASAALRGFATANPYRRLGVQGQVPVGESARVCGGAYPYQPGAVGAGGFAAANPYIGIGGRAWVHGSAGVRECAPGGGCARAGWRAERPREGTDPLPHGVAVGGGRMGSVRYKGVLRLGGKCVGVSVRYAAACRAMGPAGSREGAGSCLTGVNRTSPAPVDRG